MFGKMRNLVMNGEGLVWRGTRFAGRQSKRYACDMGRTALFTMKSVALLAALGTSYVGFNTVTGRDGYQLSYPTQRYALQEVVDGKFEIATPDGTQTFAQVGDSWFVASEDNTELVSNSRLSAFLDTCKAYVALANGRNLPKPVMESTSWFPNGVEYTEN